MGSKDYDRPGQLQRTRTPDLENSRKTAEKGAKWAPRKVPGKQPKNIQKNTRSMQNSCFSAVWLPIRLFFGCFPGTLRGAHSAPFSAVFRLFFGCFQGPAFGASVAGRADRKARSQKNGGGPQRGPSSLCAGPLLLYLFVGQEPPPHKDF